LNWKLELPGAGAGKVAAAGQAGKEALKGAVKVAEGTASREGIVASLRLALAVVQVPCKPGTRG